MRKKNQMCFRDLDMRIASAVKRKLNENLFFLSVSFCLYVCLCFRFNAGKAK